MTERIKMASDGLYQIDTGYACGGIEVLQNQIILTAPIFKWMVGKTIEDIKQWKKIKHIVKC